MNRSKNAEQRMLDMLFGGDEIHHEVTSKPSTTPTPSVSDTTIDFGAPPRKKAVDGKSAAAGRDD